MKQKFKYSLVIIVLFLLLQSRALGVAPSVNLTVTPDSYKAGDDIKISGSVSNPGPCSGLHQSIRYSLGVNGQTKLSEAGTSVNFSFSATQSQYLVELTFWCGDETQTNNSWVVPVVTKLVSAGSNIPPGNSVGSDCPPGQSGKQPNCVLDNPAKGQLVDIGDFGTLISRIIEILLMFAGAIAVIFLIIGGFQYVMSHGNEEAMEKAKKTIQSAVIGIVIIVMAFAIVLIINNLLTKTPSEQGKTTYQLTRNML